jgi:hypothetical protein
MKKISVFPSLTFVTFCALGFMTHTLSAQLPGSLTDGLVAYYPFQGNASNAVSTSFGLQISPDASLTNNQTGAPNSAYYFSGQGGVGLQSTNNFPFLPSLTVSAWFHMPLGATSKGRIVENNFGQGSWVIVVDPTELVVSGALIPSNYDGNNLIVFTNTVSLGTWNQAALSFDQTSGVAAFYLNGALMSTISSLPPLRNLGDYPIEVGGLDERFIGSISDVTIYNRALSDDEVLALYNAERPVYEVTLTLKSSTNMTDWVPVLTNIVETYNPQEFYKNDISVRIKAP